MVSNLKKVILLTPEIMHYHKSLKKILEQKKIICQIYSTRKKNYQYQTSNNQTYLNIFSALDVIKKNQNFLICGNSTLKNIFIIFILNFILKKNYFLLSDSHNKIKKKETKYILKIIFFKLFMGNVKAVIVPGIKSKNYLKNFFPNKKFYFFANYPFDFTLLKKNKEIKKKSLQILIVSRWVAEKNLDFTISELNKFSKKHTKLRIILNLVTDKTKSFLSEKVIINKNITLKIYNQLNRSSIHILMKKSQLLIMLSKFEPWGIVIEESGLLKLPSIISNNCGASELAGNNYKGICKLNSNHFKILLEKFIFDKYTKKNISNWIIRPRNLNSINQNINEFLLYL